MVASMESKIQPNHAVASTRYWYPESWRQGEADPVPAASFPVPVNTVPYSSGQPALAGVLPLREAATAHR